MNQTEYDQHDAEIQSDAKSCSCEKTTCMIGIASIAIGIGGFIAGSLL